MDELKQTQPKLFINSLAEYKQIFGLKDFDLSKKIVDLYAGFSSFNIEGSERGYKIVSTDTFYAADITNNGPLFADWQENLKNFIGKYAKNFDWTSFGGANNYLQTRLTIANHFFADFEQRYADRYKSIAGFDVALPFVNNQFQLALCAYTFFSNTALNDEQAYQWITEVCRVASELRVYPILNPQGQTPELLGPLMLKLQMNNFGVAIEQVAYQFQKGGNAMLKIWSQECQV